MLVAFPLSPGSYTTWGEGRYALPKVTECDCLEGGYGGKCVDGSSTLLLFYRLLLA